MPSSTDTAITLAVVGILATCVGGLLWIIKYLFTKLLPVIEKLTDTTEASAEYLRERNGRDAKVHKELIKAVDKIPTKIASEAMIVAKELKRADKNETRKVKTRGVIK